MNARKAWLHTVQFQLCARHWCTYLDTLERLLVCDGAQRDPPLLRYPEQFHNNTIIYDLYNWSHSEFRRTRFLCKDIKVFYVLRDNVSGE